MFRCWLVVFTAMLLTACKPPTIPLAPPPATPQVVRVMVNPALDGWLPSLSGCASTLQGGGLVIDSWGTEDMALVDLVLRFDPVIEADSFASELAQDQVVMVVNPSNTVTSLTQEQVTAIYSGRVQNWRQVGGEDAPISVWTYLPGDDARRVFDAVFLPGTVLGRKVLPLPYAAAMLEVVGEEAQAIGFILQSRLTSAVRQVTLSGPLQASLRHPVAATAARQPGGAAYDLLVCLQTTGVSN